MYIDFSMSADDWMKIIREFFQIIQNFFKEIGINIFSTSESDTPSEEGE